MLLCVLSGIWRSLFSISRPLFLSLSDPSSSSAGSRKGRARWIFHAWKPSWCTGARKRSGNLLEDVFEYETTETGVSGRGRSQGGWGRDGTLRRETHTHPQWQRWLQQLVHTAKGLFSPPSVRSVVPRTEHRLRHKDLSMSLGKSTSPMSGRMPHHGSCRLWAETYTRTKTIRSGFSAR